jgi:hypothetical protein
MRPLRSAAADIASVINDWLSHPEKLEAIRREMSDLADQVAQPGGISRAADTIVQLLDVPVPSRKAA